MRYFLPLFLFLVIGGFLWKGLNLNPKEIPSALVGNPAPHFYLGTVENPNHFVSDQIFIGKVTVLNVWATWCVSCKAEHVVWMDLAKKHNLFLVGINYHDDLKLAQRWLKAAGDPYTVCIFDKAGKFGLDYGVYGTPETFIIDKAGVVRYREAGPIDPQLWHSTLLPLIESLQK
ncbi:MAG TPA: DsbE family thiol:disulfide interchange protein [Gammaproteobacteria bacterium]|nr:DsbE family thiol:disulfide interchange protein [Gammaproteobacteria bacterium]